MRNVGFCSIFKCELIAIDKGPDLISSLPPTKEIWILTDSKIAVRHLANWHIVRDFIVRNILKKFKNFCRSHQIPLEWIPSDVVISGNEAFDRLAKAGASEVTVFPVSLTFSELFSIAKFKNKSDWLTPPIQN